MDFLWNSIILTKKHLDSFDLSDDKYKGAVFTITYISEPEIDELDEEVMVNTHYRIKNDAISIVKYPRGESPFFYESYLKIISF